MSVVARRIASMPRRTSVETWQRICELVSAEGSDSRAELKSVTSTAAMLLAEEYAKEVPITVSSGGPLVRIYTLHGTDALEHDFDDESPLSFDPTAGDSWLLSLPAEGVDLKVAQKALAESPRVDVRDVGEAVESAAARGAARVRGTGGRSTRPRAQLGPRR